ncbi:response regulator transcription factor [Clostridium bornimense]|uniref:response regulator transcription factor n=1 Tax=Clostridium bornimense TaxID=1216932 RepID=UPI001C114EF9|nr:response regulator transcription factor [Clostridium bornimense]MBU5315209.1 response regulator transcription factor [Clostridium bornimense]
MKSRLLIVEDDKDIALMMKEYLLKEDYEVYTAFNGEDGIKVFKENTIDFILLDVMMPGIDGFTVLEKIRGFSSVPVIMLTAKGQQMDKILAFKRGCDDYIVKPFDLVEVSLRITAILRRGNNINYKNSLIMYKGLTIDKDQYKVIKDKGEIKLTKKEFEILLLLMEHPGRVYTSEMIYNKVWKDTYVENDNTVITHIGNLREKLGDKVKDPIFIKTIWGVGYKVEKDN